MQENRAGSTAGGFPGLGGPTGVYHLLDLSLVGQISDTALTQPKAIELTASGLPTTFVPGRNLLFFTFAAAIAYRRGLAPPRVRIVVAPIEPRTWGRR